MILRFNEFNSNPIVEGYDELSQTEKDFVKLFDKYQSDILDVSDLNLEDISGKCMLTHVNIDENNIIHFWSGNPETDSTEELLLDDASRYGFMKEIIKHM